MNTSPTPVRILARAKALLYAEPALAIVIGAMFVYAAVVVVCTGRVAGGSDSAGYLGSARLFAAGRIGERVSELRELGLPDAFLSVFIPLGFAPAHAHNTLAATYPPGLPLQMAAAGLLGGWRNAPFLVSGLTGTLELLLVYLLAREFKVSARGAVAAVVIVGVCPSFLYFALQPMSDVNATFWCSLALLCGLRAQKRNAYAVWAGAAYGMSVLVRPSNLFFALPLLLAMPMRWRPMLLLLAGGAAPAAFLGWYDTVAYGNPLTIGYGSIAGQLLALSNFPPRVRHYSVQMLLQLSPIVPCAWLFALGRSSLTGQRRAVLAAWFLVFFGFYVFYAPYQTWWYARFLLPGVPALAIGATWLWTEAERAMGANVSLIRSVGSALLLSIVGCQAFQISDYHVLDLASGEIRQYVDTTTEAGRIFPKRAYVVSMQTSGALRYYQPGFHVVRPDRLDANAARTLSKHLVAHNRELYALLFSFELAEAQALFAGFDWRKLGDFDGITLWRIDMNASR